MREEKPDSKKFEWEWSPKHTRLRYQLLVSAIVVYYTCSYQLTAFTVPILFAKLEEGTGPSQCLLIVSTMSFYFFTLASFGVRSKNETKDKGIFQKRLATEIEKVTGAIEKLDANSKKLIKNATHDLPNLEEIMVSFEDLRHDVRAFPISKHYASSQITVLENEGVGPDEAYHKQDISRIRDTTLEYLGQIKGLLQKREGEIRTNEVEFKSSLEKGVSSITSTFEKAGKDLEKILARESKDKKTYYLEREVLGLWLPILVSVVIVGWGLIQFLINCKEIIA